MTNEGQRFDGENLGSEQWSFFGELSIDVSDLFGNGNDHQLGMLPLDTIEQFSNS